jgi:hypothetical protein
MNSAWSRNGIKPMFVLLDSIKKVKLAAIVRHWMRMMAIVPAA